MSDIIGKLRHQAGCLESFDVDAQYMDEAADEIESLRSRLAGADREATALLMAMVERWPDRSPEWRPLPDVAGKITQISNLSAGFRDRLAEAEALLREIRHERRAEPYSMDGTSQWVLLRQNDFARIDFLIADSADVDDGGPYFGIEDQPSELDRARAAADESRAAADAASPPDHLPNAGKP